MYHHTKNKIPMSRTLNLLFEQADTNSTMTFKPSHVCDITFVIATAQRELGINNLHFIQTLLTDIVCKFT